MSPHQGDAHARIETEVAGQGITPLLSRGFLGVGGVLVEYGVTHVDSVDIAYPHVH